MIRISVSADVRRLTATLDDIARRQVPYAKAQAINALAFEVQRAERAAIPSVFKNPRPFTRNGVLVAKATKASPTATVYMRAEVAKYLAPYEFGGKHELPGRALLNPKRISLDQYGQLTRTTTQRLTARPNVFVGRVGNVNGFWQRMKGDKLKLLIRFGDAIEVHKRLEFRARGQALLSQRFAVVFGEAMQRALATMRR